jgi:formylglycine-generating enzyme required for sulfatase activity/serine/threonine protein kinase
MPTGQDDDRVIDILERWEALRRAGQDASIDNLCAACEELAGDVRRRIIALDRLGAFLADAESHTPLTVTSKLHLNEGQHPPISPILVPAVISLSDLRFHARGGLGEVFQGYDEPLRRWVAIKVLRWHCARSPVSRRRFENEAEITSRLDHPGVAPVYALGNAGDGRPYYAMRFIRGETMEEAIDRFHSGDMSGRDAGEHRLAFRQLLVRFQDVCNTIAYAHSKAVLHRDLKPRNVMLGEFGETIVVDWGLAKQLGDKPRGRAGEPGTDGQSENLTDHAGDTRPDEAMGSPGYMSPEQASGELNQIGPASDVYSLGAILYYLLTGRVAISGSDLATITRRTRAGEFVSPSQVDPSVHPALEAICLKAMALRPEDRYTSPQDVAEELGRWMADEPVLAWREPAAIRIRRWLRLHRSLVTSITVALCSCLVAFGVFLYFLSVRAARSQADRLAEARGLVESLAFADVSAVPEIVRRLDPDIELVTDRLYAMSRATQAGLDPKRHRTAVAIALLRLDSSQASYLVDRLIHEDSPPPELSVIRQALIDRGKADAVATYVWKLLDGGPRARSEFVHLLAQVDPKPDKLLERIRSSQDNDHTRATLVLALGAYPIKRLAPSEREWIAQVLLRLFRSSPDAGLHSALRWLLGHEWGLERELSQFEAECASKDCAETRFGRAPGRNWYVNGQMQTMALIRGPVEFMMGSPESEVGRRPWREDRLLWRVERTFAIATNEVTRSQYEEFLDENPDVFRPDSAPHHDRIGKYMPDPGCPVIGINFYEATRYCNWLNLKEGIPDSEWCYPKHIDPKKPLILSPNYLSRNGYRLPTEAEWELACRAGTQTSRPFGDSGAWMPAYAWFLENSLQRTHPVGSKKPNDFGLFDMLGNAIEWTFQIYDAPGDYLVRDSAGVLLDREITRIIEDRLDCMLRGGSFYYDVSSLRSANRNWNSPALRENTFGFRVARTLHIPVGESPAVSRVPRGGSGEK